MSGAALERLLARLYTDAELRARLRVDPEAIAREAGLTPAERAELATLDRAGLELAAESFRRKRAGHAHRRAKPGWLARLASLWRR